MRYDPCQAHHFELPDHILERPGAEGDFVFELAISISGFVLYVVANLHNTVMNAEETSPLTKFAAVILLAAGALFICPIAIAETLIRIALYIAALFILPCFLGCRDAIEWLTILTLHALIQILSAPHLARQCILSEKTVKPLRCTEA